ncbi:hypothetical protein [Salinicola avicenniae]|uniref:hypothetical protein n=1 Tax=Salinicola avicenniae TaxID=2916836 RepID=UPI002073DD0C|nr:MULTISPECIES: hypothetical protein [unclassified Salinicola]
MLRKSFLFLLLVVVSLSASAFEVKPGLWEITQTSGEGGGESSGQVETTKFCYNEKYVSDYAESVRADLEYAGFQVDGLEEDSGSVHMTITDSSLTPPFVADIILEKISDEHVVYKNLERAGSVPEYVDERRFISKDC